MNPVLKVQAVPGKLLMFEKARGFVGYKRARGDDAVSHSVPEGFAWTISGAVEVPSTTYYRRALQRGEIKLATEPAPKPKAAKKED